MSDFKKYPSITNLYKEEFLDRITRNNLDNGDWYVQEKIHGSNYGLTSNGEFVIPSRRTGYIEEDESFYNHKEALDKYADSVREIAIELSSTITVYGELCGGAYNGESKGTKVQSGVQYIPHNDFFVFDIMASDDFIDFDKVISVCEGRLKLAPVLFYGTFGQCINYDKEIKTRVPEMFGLPDIEENICEGVVIKPNKVNYDRFGNRIIIKNKNAKFKETDRKEKVKEADIPEELESIISRIEANINQNRLSNVISKIGEVDIKSFGKLCGLLIQDAIGDCDIKEYRNLEKIQMKLINKRIAKKSNQEIKKYFGVV